jgi:hypothetical protein
MMTMLTWALVQTSAAGTLLYFDSGEAYVQAMDTRTLEVADFAPATGLGSPVAGLAFDGSDILWMHWQQGSGEIVWSSPPYAGALSWRGVFGDYYPDYYNTHAIAYDPVVGQVVVFAKGPGNGLYHLGGTRISDGPDVPRGATWDTNSGGFLVVEGDRDLHAIVNYGAPVLVGTAPAAAQTDAFGLAYDQDTNIIWLVTSGLGVFGLDPFTYEQVAWVPSGPRALYGATSYNYDPVPDFEPELLVTGTCPGEVFVTAVDHTPGGQVKIFSGTRPGALVSPPGAPCAGASLGMRNPVLRGTLTANSLGLASTKFQAPASMCGSWRFQAVDVSTCTPSSVRGLP